MLTWVWRTARRCMMTSPRASPTATRSSTPCSFLPHCTSWWHWHTGTSKSCKRFFWFVITIFMLYGIFWLCCWWKYIHIRLLTFLDYTYAVHAFIYMHTQKMKFSTNGKNEFLPRVVRMWSNGNVFLLIAVCLRRLHYSTHGLLATEILFCRLC